MMSNYLQNINHTRTTLLHSILLIVLSFSSVNSQAYEHEYFNKNEGMLDNFVYDFDINKDNNVWLATRAGISVYDGFNFTTVLELSNEINYINIRFDKEGRLWLMKDIHETSVDIVEKIIIFDPQTKSISRIDQLYPEAKNILSKNSNYSLKTDIDNNLSIIGKKNLPIVYLEENRLVKYYPKYKDTHLTFEVEDPYTILSKNETKDTIAFENIKTGELKKYASADLANCIEKQKKLVVKTSQNINSGPTKNKSVMLSEDLDTLFRQGNPNFKYSSMSSNIVIGSSDKIIVYNPINKSYKSLTHQLGTDIKNSTITRIKAHNGIIWVGTSNGLFKITQKNKLFHTILDDQQLYIRQILYHKDSKLLVCSENGIYEVDLSNGTNRLLIDDVPTYTLTQMDSLNFIVGSHNILTQKWNILEDSIKTTKPHFNYKIGSPSGGHLFYHKDINDKYWLISNFGFSRYYPELDSVVILNDILNIKHKVFNIFPNPLDSTKLFLPYTNGIYEFDIQSEEIKNIEAFNDIIPSYITKDKYKKGVLWVGTKYEGLLKWTYGQKFIDQQFSIEDGLKSNNVHSVFFDKQANIWMSTDNGISILDRQTNKINTLTTTHGLHENEFNKHSSLALGDSMFVFGGIDGLVYFDPNKANYKSTKNSTTIIGYSYIDNKTGNQITRNIKNKKDEGIGVLPNQLNFKLLLSKPIPPNPQTLKYLIAGVSNDWQYSRNSIIPVNNLQKGINRLLISRQIGVNKWSPTQTVTLISPAPWYSNYWVQTLIFFTCFLAIIVYLTRVKIKTQKLNYRITEEVYRKTAELRIKNEKLEKSQNLNDQLFTIIGHDLRSPLISLGKVGKSLTYLTNKGDKKDIERLTSTIEYNATNTLKIIDSLLEWTHLKRTETLNLSHVNLNEVVKTAIADKRSAAQNKNISIINNFTTDSDVKTDKESVHIIVRNLICNAIKFSNPNDRILIQTDLIKNDFVISVDDNGLGLSDELIFQLKNRDKIKARSGTNYEQGLGMGLSISSYLAENINASIEFKQKKQKGSIVSLTIPIE